MVAATKKLLHTVAEELCLSSEEVVKRGLRSLVERQLREINAEIFHLTGHYNVFNVQEMEARYQDGTLEEASSWKDLQRLDHLEYKQERLLTILKTL